MSIQEQIQGELSRGRTADEVVEGLVRKGLSEPTARRFVDRAQRAPAVSAAPPALRFTPPGSTDPAQLQARRRFLGPVLGQSLRIWFANLAPFLILTLICYSPLLLYSIDFLNTRMLTPRSAMAHNIIKAVLTLTSLGLAAGALTYGVVQHIRGQRASIGQCIGVGLSRLLPIIGVALAEALLIIAILLPLAVVASEARTREVVTLCQIAGVVLVFGLMSRLWVSVSVALVERPGVVAALRRSAALTKGYRWGVLGILILLGLIDWGLDEAIEAALLGPEATIDDFKTYSYLVLFAGVLLGSWGSTAQAVGYSELRLDKEGVDAEQIARVFE